MATKTAQRPKMPPPPPMPSRTNRRKRRVTSLAQSWREQSWGLRVLRAFLGATFAFAGFQKFLDPNFLHPRSPSYIGQQLQGFIKAGSPIAFFLRIAAH